MQVLLLRVAIRKANKGATRITTPMLWNKLAIQILVATILAQTFVVLQKQRLLTCKTSGIGNSLLSLSCFLNERCDDTRYEFTRTAFD